MEKDVPKHQRGTSGRDTPVTRVTRIRCAKYILCWVGVAKFRLWTPGVYIYIYIYICNYIILYIYVYAYVNVYFITRHYPHVHFCHPKNQLRPSQGTSKSRNLAKFTSLTDCIMRMFLDGTWSPPADFHIFHSSRKWPLEIVSSLKKKS